MVLPAGDRRGVIIISMIITTVSNSINIIGTSQCCCYVASQDLDICLLHGAACGYKQTLNQTINHVEIKQPFK